MFNLSPDEVKEIMLEYCDSLNVITAVISEVNELNLVNNEEDFFNLVAAVCTRYQTIKETAFPDLNSSKESDPFAADREIRKLLNLEAMINYVWKRLNGEDKEIQNHHSHQYIMSPRKNLYNK